MLQQLNKEIPRAQALAIIFISAAILGGYTIWQHIIIQQEKTDLPEIKIIKETEGIIKTCEWTMDTCQESIGDCYLISGTERGEEIICAGVAQFGSERGISGKLGWE